MEHSRTKNGSHPGAGADLRGLIRDLGAGEAMCSAILSSALDPLFIIDEQGEILAASRSVERVFGYVGDALIGKNIRILMPEPHRSKHDQYLKDYRRTGITHILGRTRQFQVVRKDGSLIYCDLSVSRADLQGREAPLFIGSFRDVTDRNRAEQALRDSERRLHAIFDKSFQYIGLLDPDGTLLEANQTALDGLGVKRVDVVGKPFWETPWWRVSEETREQLRHAIRRAAAGEFVRFETHHRGREGELLSIDFSLSPVEDDDGKVVLLIPEGRDITELKRAQHSETAMLRSLATIGESAAVLAHEIKNPITSVNLALRAVADKLGEDHRAILEDLAGRMQRLERIMRRTLSFTQPVELEKTEVDAHELLVQVLDDLGPAIDLSGTEVRLEPLAAPIALRADWQLLGEVLTNLVANGLEALKEHGGRLVVLSVEEDGKQAVRFTVEDDGSGIPVSLRETLFKPFHTTKKEGSGLGLAFCKKVVEEHGGTISVQDSALGGARFEVSLPTTSDGSPC